MKKLFLLMFAMVAMIATAQNFTIDLSQENPTLPEGVTQVSYAQHGHGFNGAQHGHTWFAFTFQAEGAVRITLGGCQYINSGYEGYVEVAGTKLADIPNKTAGCYDPNDPTANIGVYEYTGAAAELTVYCGQYCPFVQVETITISDTPETIETELVRTSFSDWEGVTHSDKENPLAVDTRTLTTKKTNEEITFTLTGCSVYPTGGGKVSAMSDGYICGMKADGDNLATIETSVFASVTTVSYFHRATGNNRGWGLQVKGDGDEDWVTVYDQVTNSTGAMVENIAVNRTNVQLRWYNLSQGNYAALSQLTINGLYTPAARTFQNFEIDLTQETPVLPANVEQVSYAQHGAAYHGNQHGWMWYAVKFAVDGPVKITLGGCQYTGENAKVYNAANEQLAEIDQLTVGCYHNGGIATWTYNVEAADELTVYCGQYCPYIKVEACEYVADVEVEYYNQDGVKLGATSVAPDAPLTFTYTIDNIPEGYAFRGWYQANGKKFYEGTAPMENIKLYAHVTAIEEATVGAIFRYPLNDQFLYLEDHECILNNGGSFHDAQHGWAFGNGNQILLPVAGKAYVQIGLCQYSNEADITVTTTTGTEVTTFPAKVEACAAHTFFYDGAADTLVITFANTTYISLVNVYNVAAPVAKAASGYYEIAAGDAAGLLLALMQAEDGDKIFLPNGLYDLGEICLTPINKNNLSIIGQSAEHTIIRNAPDTKNEGIGTTATLLISGNNTYLQDLTIQNALDYYKVSTGRAVTIQDKGTNTICKNVNLLSYQDTYYSNKPSQVCYFEGGSIHGTVDYICGSGSIYFNQVELFCEKRKADGSGSDCITASNAQAAQGDKGYVFESCVIKSECPVISLSRTWNDQPQVVYLNTTLDYSAGNFGFVDDKGEINRWTIKGMNNCDPYLFGEYNTMDVQGNVISPASHILTFIGTNNPQVETILTVEQAAQHSYAAFFGETWNPAADAAQVALTYTLENGVATWSETSATHFLKETAEGTEIITALPAVPEEGAIYRAANARGGFGEPASEIIITPNTLNNTTLTTPIRKYIENGMVIIERNNVKYSTLGQIIR